MRTVKEIAEGKDLTPLQKQMILGYCNDADIVTEEDLNMRKIYNRQIFRKCITALNKSNPKVNGKPYINIVGSMNAIKDEHDFYVVSTTFGFRYYNKYDTVKGTPAMKLTKMLETRCNNLNTCYITKGRHFGLKYFYTGLLLAYLPHQYYKVNTYDVINEHYNGYKASRKEN